jgi:hypothetical protein
VQREMSSTGTIKGRQEPSGTKGVYVPMPHREFDTDHQLSCRFVPRARTRAVGRMLDVPIPSTSRKE